MLLKLLATSTSSETLFIRSGKIATPSRASLKPNKIEMPVFFSKILIIIKFTPFIIFPLCNQMTQLRSFEYTILRLYRGIT